MERSRRFSWYLLAAPASEAVLLVLVLVGVFAWHPGGNDMAGSPAGSGAPGFWAGLWHASTVIITFWISLFRDDVGIYAVHNAGTSYDVGYALGIGSLLVSARVGVILRYRSRAWRRPLAGME